MKVVKRFSSDDSNEILFERMSFGSETAYYELFERFWEPLYVSSFKILRDRELAKDVVQEIFIGLWEKRNNISVQNVSGYLNQAAKFASLKEIRDGKQNLFDDVESIENHHSTIHQELEAEELNQQITTAIDSLPIRCKEVFLLSRNNQLSNKEIADKLNLSQRTVETHISNALKHLKKHIPKEHLLLIYLTFFS